MKYTCELHCCRYSSKLLTQIDCKVKSKEHSDQTSQTYCYYRLPQFNELVTQCVIGQREMVIGSHNIYMSIVVYEIRTAISTHILFLNNIRHFAILCHLIAFTRVTKEIHRHGGW